MAGQKGVAFIPPRPWTLFGGPTCFRSCSWCGWATKVSEAPSLASAQAMAAPMPREAPVSNAFLPCRSDMAGCRLSWSEKAALADSKKHNWEARRATA